MKVTSPDSISWTKKTPPQLVKEVGILVAALARIETKQFQDDLSCLLEDLQHQNLPAVVVSQDGRHMREILAGCRNAEKRTVLNDFYLFMCLVQLAFWIEWWAILSSSLPCSSCSNRNGSGKSINELAKTYGYQPRQLYDWYEQGTRLVILCGASECNALYPYKFSELYPGSFYILPVLAVLHLKAKLLYRKGSQTEHIFFLANVLRNPGSEWSAISLLFFSHIISVWCLHMHNCGNRIVPTISRLFHSKSLSHIFRLLICSELAPDGTAEAIMLNFSDLALSEDTLNKFQTKYGSFSLGEYGTKIFAVFSICQ